MLVSQGKDLLSAWFSAWRLGGYAEEGSPEAGKGGFKGAAAALCM